MAETSEISLANLLEEPLMVEDPELMLYPGRNPDIPAP